MEQILTEYKIRAKNLHPDKNLESQEASKKFFAFFKISLVNCPEKKKLVDLKIKCFLKSENFLIIC